LYDDDKFGIHCTAANDQINVLIHLPAYFCRI